ncbi:type II 3-dehydroquinate dehydratase [Labrys monachus]|uniref:3-dehydroquinate dehydratase n=1 Tax=Labrys monachus TaxID=217067 RepID=A0ABU0FF60_9HYPH|nr:type II 3-dehydroquinate dehydratase [Labrys monachus]MDQ0393249.1 3-dehydroquinate dehydratase-2 [Labrys monachus]
MALVYVLNGPNLNMLGVRETSVYGTIDLAGIEKLVHARAERLGMTAEFRQTNHEGVLLDWVHESHARGAVGMVINPGALTHTSIALHDAIKAISLPVIELHLSNVFARESFRHHSWVSPAAKGVICGFGPKGYELALEALASSVSAQ